MRVNGELFLLMNGWMDFLCLTLTACLVQRRLQPGRMILAAGMGAVYALIAWMQGGWLLRMAVMLAAALGMTVTAFGRDGLLLWPLTVSAGLFFAGAVDYLLARGLRPWAAMLLCGGITAAVTAMMRRSTASGQGAFRLRLTVNGRTLNLPAFRDSGNLLRDGATGLPVIVAPETMMKPLLPEGFSCRDLATLPRGWHLTRIRTAAGERCLMCFRPDRVWLIRGKVARPVHAAVAVSDFAGSRALLPEAIFMQEEGRNHAGF